MYHHKNNLELHKVSLEDARLLLYMKNKSWTTQHQSVILSHDDQFAFITNLQKSTTDYYLRVQTSTALIIGIINICHIDWISRCADVGMMANPCYRGQSETQLLPEILTDFAFEFLNLNRLQAEVLDNNPAALKFDLSLGYQIEGRKRKAIYKGGVYHDSLMIAMLREDWEKSERVKAYGGICNKDYKRRKPIDRIIEKFSK